MSNPHIASDPSPSSLLRALLVGGGLIVLWRLGKGLVSLFWTLFGLAVAWWFIGAPGFSG